MVKVGYALKEKRIKSLITDELVEYGKIHAVEFFKIDPLKPLIEQGKFDLILHKIISDEWASELSKYAKTYPEAIIIDNYDSIRRLDDRIEMLKVVSNLNLESLHVDVRIPNQIQIDADVAPESIPNIIEKSSMKLPAVAKPLSGLSNPNAHSLSLVLSSYALAHLHPPVVIQEFVNHGGALFKLYVLGDRVMAFKRNSLPDIPCLPEPTSEPISEPTSDQIKFVALQSHASEPGKKYNFQELIQKGAGLVEFSQISNLHLSEAEMHASTVEDPPAEFMRQLAAQLRHSLGIECFNVDILRENGDGDRYYVVDVNYLPGYERLPDFESMFVDFILTSVKRHRETLHLSSEPISEVELPLKLSETKSPIVPYPTLPKKKRWITIRAALNAKMFHH